MVFYYVARKGFSFLLEHLTRPIPSLIRLHSYIESVSLLDFFSDFESAHNIHSHIDLYYSKGLSLRQSLIAKVLSTSSLTILESVSTV